MAKVKALLMDIEQLYLQRQTIQEQLDVVKCNLAKLAAEKHDVETKLLALIVHDPKICKQFVKINHDKLEAALFGRVKPYNHPAERKSKDV